MVRYRPRGRRRYTRRRPRRYMVRKRFIRYNKFNPRMKRAPKPEIKAYDVSNDWAQFVAATWSFVLLNNILIGDGRSNRDGAEYIMTNIYVRLGFSVDTSQTSEQSMTRVILLYDKEPHASAPTSANLLQSTTDVFSPVNLSYTKRFRILASKIVALGPTHGPTCRYISFAKSVRLRTHCNGVNGGGIGDIEQGAIYLVMMDDLASYNNNYKYYARIRFLDP